MLCFYVELKSCFHRGMEGILGQSTNKQLHFLTGGYKITKAHSIALFSNDSS